MAAEAAVRKLSGVVWVTNRLAVRPDIQPAREGPHPGGVPGIALFEADAIKVSVEGDKVTLEGAVTAWAEREAAERAAGLSPASRVEDRIVALR